MNLAINRLDPNVPDPVESRRRVAGRLVRVAYATIVFGVLAFMSSISAGHCSTWAGPASSRPRASSFRFPTPCTSAA